MCVQLAFYGKKEYFDVAVQPAVEEDKVTEACERLSKSLKAKVEKGQTTVEEIATCLNDCIQHIYNGSINSGITFSIKWSKDTLNEMCISISRNSMESTIERRL